MARARQEPQREPEGLVERPAVESAASVEPPYRSRPADDVIARFLQHVRRTGQPETFPTICRVPPPADSPPIFLKPFDVDRSKRPDGDRAPCSICSPYRPKFLHGGFLVWYPLEGVIRAIGPECGDALFGGTQYADGRIACTRREREDAALGFLQTNLPKTLQMVLAMEAIRPAAREVSRLHRKFKTEAPNVQAKLRAVRSGGGALSVGVVAELDVEADDRIEGPKGLGSGGAAYNVTFGSLPDSPMLNATFDPMQEWEELRYSVFSVPAPPHADAALEWVIENAAEVEQMEAMVKRLRRCSEDYVKFAERLDRCLQLFSPELFAVLDAWGRHPQNVFKLKAHAENGVFKFEHERRYDTWTHRERVTLVPDVTKLVVRGNWPGFE